MKVVENLSHLFYFIAIIGITPSNLSSPSGGRTFSPIADTPRDNPGEDVRNDKYFELFLKEGYIYIAKEEPELDSLKKSINLTSKSVLLLCLASFVSAEETLPMA